MQAVSLNPCDEFDSQQISKLLYTWNRYVLN
jgi:hypothetical protein